MQKRLTKSADNIVLTGTIGGIGEYLGIDPTILRILYAIIVCCGVGSPVLLYIVLAVLLPAGTNKTDTYGHNNTYYQAGTKKKHVTPTPKEDDWSDF